MKPIRIMPAFQEVCRPRDIAPNLFAGFMAGLMTLIAGISYAALIFSGSLTPYLNLGIASAMVSSAVIGFTVACRSSSPFIIAGPDANISAIVALMAASIAAQMRSAGSGPLYATLWAGLALSTALTGLALYLLGRFSMGRWIRFIPYPVIGGFLAGTGWLLVSGSFNVMVNLPLTAGSAAQLLQPERSAHWLPGVGLALALTAALRIWKHYLIMPGLLLAGIACVHAVLLSAGMAPAQAAAEGWLLAPLPAHLLVQSLQELSPGRINWQLLLVQSPDVLALMAVAAIVILLNAASIEIASRTDIDLDAELKSNGLANVFAAPFGGLVGCIALTRTLLNFRAGATSRVSGMAAALLCAGMLLAGAQFVTYIPRAVLGGLLLYLGLSLLIEWVYDGWWRLSRFDYGLVLAIIVIIAVFGFLPGVGVGILAATLLFAFNYSRINVVKTEFTGAVLHSNVQRTYRERDLLQQKGEQIAILRLQGFIFFGTAYNLLVHVHDLVRAEGRVPARYLMLDFRFVSGIDSSSVLIFSKMGQFAEANGVCLIFVQLQPGVRAMLHESGCIPAADGPSCPHCSVFADMDHAIEWCENQLLAGAQLACSRVSCSLKEHLADFFSDPAMIDRLMQYLERIEEPAGYRLFVKGTPAKHLYFIESGTVTAYLESDSGMRKRLRTMGAGTVVGEIGLYLGMPRSASVYTDGPGVLYRLKADDLALMEAQDAELASAFHRFIVRLVAGRLMHANEELQMLS
jgi:SulP family sulfate permease